MISITRKFEFHSAHYLPNYDGKCSRQHGHTYILEVEVAGKIKAQGPKTGMIMDFGELKISVDKVVIEKLDHELLNDVWENPTAEVMVEDIAIMLLPFLPGLVRVRLYETTNSYAEWRKDESFERISKH